MGSTNDLHNGDINRYALEGWFWQVTGDTLDSTSGAQGGELR